MLLGSTEASSWAPGHLLCIQWQSELTQKPTTGQYAGIRDFKAILNGMFPLNPFLQGSGIYVEKEMERLLLRARSDG